MKLELSPQLSTQQTLSLRLQRASHILQLSALEIQELLDGAMNDNPLLDMDSPAFTAPAPPATLRWENVKPHKQSGAPEPGHNWRSPSTRNEVLLENIRLSQADDQCQALCTVLVDALDDNGYLQEPYETLLPPGSGQVSQSEWEAALALIQNLSPAGIGARCVEESLMIQLKAREDFTPPQRKAVERLIQSGLSGDAPLLRLDSMSRDTRKHLTTLETQLKQLGSDLAEALALLQQLDPKPGRSILPLQPQLLTPDVYVIQDAGRWTVIPDRQSLPLVQVDQHYAELIGTHAKACAPDLRNALTEARWLSESLVMRRQTVCRVAQHIVERQQLFFELGESALQPLKISDLAEALDLHESTISRATANKYMHTPMGLLSFRSFFSSQLNTHFGGSCASSSVKARIRQLIEAEDPSTPLSDVQIHQQLLEAQIEISKRTVTKYRLQLKLPNAVERKRQTLLKVLPVLA